MIVFEASKYKNRTELEVAVRNSFGLTTSPKKAKISGTKIDLAKLSFDAESIYWGIECEVVEELPDVKTNE